MVELLRRRSTETPRRSSTDIGERRRADVPAQSIDRDEFDVSFMSELVADVSRIGLSEHDVNGVLVEAIVDGASLEDDDDAGRSVVGSGGNVPSDESIHGLILDVACRFVKDSIERTNPARCAGSRRGWWRRRRGIPAMGRRTDTRASGS